MGWFGERRSEKLILLGKTAPHVDILRVPAYLLRRTVADVCIYKNKFLRAFYVMQLSFTDDVLIRILNALDFFFLVPNKFLLLPHESTAYFFFRSAVMLTYYSL